MKEAFQAMSQNGENMYNFQVKELSSRTTHNVRVIQHKYYELLFLIKLMYQKIVVSLYNEIEKLVLFIASSTNMG